MDNKEKLEEAKRLYETANADQKYVLESLFPELQESEDERIRKDIIATIHLYYGEPLEDEAKEMIAWLEKQANHANFCNKIQISDKVTRNRDGVLVNLSQLKRVAKDEKQGEQKPADKVEPDNLIEESYQQQADDLIDMVTEKPAWSEEVQEEQVGEEFINALGTMLNDGLPDRYIVSEERIKKSAELLFSIARKQLKNEIQEWSEEDERIYQSIMDDTVQENQLNDEETNWLRDIKYRYFPQPKQEWSEEDEYHKRQILRILKDNGCSQTLQEKTEKWIEERLKSLRPQNSWKPSDEQMGALNDVISSRDIKYDVLSELWKNLKKLK